VPQTLKVEVLRVVFDDLSEGRYHGQCRVSVANLSVDHVDRLTIAVILKRDGTGPLYTVEHTYDLEIEPGDFVEVELALGILLLDGTPDSIITEVRALASRRVHRCVPTYVLPDSSTGVCAIEERCPLGHDRVVERIDISLSSNLLRNKGWARVMYLLRNDNVSSISSLSLATRFYSLSGELLGEERDTFTLGSLCSTRVTAKVTLRQVRGLGATRFEAEFDGFEDIGRGSSSYRGVETEGASRVGVADTWEGEEVTGAVWIHRPSS
jgi:hypothetical protein